MGVTVITLVAVRLPSAVVTVIVAVPGAFAITSPDAFTDATEVLEELQLTLLFDGYTGDNTAFSFNESVAITEALAGVTDTPVTGRLRAHLQTYRFR